MALTPEKIAELKARHGDALYLVETVGGDVVLRPSTEAEFDAFSDALSASISTAQHNLALACTVDPPGPAVLELFDLYPGTPEVLADEINAIAGAQRIVREGLGPHTVATLTELELDELKAAGFDLEKAKRQYPRAGQLHVMRCPWGVVLMRTPPRGAYDEYQRRKGEPGQFASATLEYCLASVLHPTVERFRAELAKLPAVKVLIAERLQQVSGATAVARAKKI
jgi:hypothetical protein